ncbi:hypothetical protein HT585_21560 [Ensifer sp. HO-A22]|uniref:Uncharacterized protein n=1 Tax=Ensifer oleiphilus TaxID=2742698 RepID=A0A7Y6UPZ0_9HYPH|nr:hypothetical protein [Ensifer oleiphilus]NVD41459.1 hypothetical protein [Ensifer oleiphilus]
MAITAFMFAHRLAANQRHLEENSKLVMRINGAQVRSCRRAFAAVSKL